MRKSFISLYAFSVFAVSLISIRSYQANLKRNIFYNSNLNTGGLFLTYISRK